MSYPGYASALEAGRTRRAFADAVVALRAMEQATGTQHLVDFGLVHQLLAQVQEAFGSTEVPDPPREEEILGELGCGEPVAAHVQRAGRGWTIVCSSCGAKPAYPKERISALIGWHEWHAYLRGCLRPTMRKHKQRRLFPSEYQGLTRAS